MRGLGWGGDFWGGSSYGREEEERGRSWVFLGATVTRAAPVARTSPTPTATHPHLYAER